MAENKNFNIDRSSLSTKQEVISGIAAGAALRGEEIYLIEDPVETLAVEPEPAEFTPEQLERGKSVLKKFLAQVTKDAKLEDIRQRAIYPR